MEKVKKSKPDVFTTPRTGVGQRKAHLMVTEELMKIWGEEDTLKLVDLWNLTQIREPYSVEEVEDLFFEVLE